MTQSPPLDWRIGCHCRRCREVRMDLRDLRVRLRRVELLLEDQRSLLPAERDQAALRQARQARCRLQRQITRLLATLDQGK